MPEKIKPVPYLELDKEIKDIKMQVLHGLRHCLINDAERVGAVSRQLGIGTVLSRSRQLRSLGQQLQKQWLEENSSA